MTEKRYLVLPMTEAKHKFVIVTTVLSPAVTCLTAEDQQASGKRSTGLKLEFYSLRERIGRNNH